MELYGIHLISDAEQGYRNTKLMVAAETVARELPEAYGYFISLYGERPAVFTSRSGRTALRV